MKDVMVVGHSSMDSFLRTDIWSLKNVHHTRVKPKETIVAIMLNVHLIPKFRRLTLLEKVMEILLKRK
jgi:hypothetical protein